MSPRRAAIVLLLIAIAGCGRDRGSAGTRDNPLALILSPEHATPETAARLEAELARHAELAVTVRVARDPERAVAEAGATTTDCALLPVFEYLLARQELGVEAITQVRRAGGAHSYRGVLLVRQDAPLQALRDLDGKAVAYVHGRSTTGFLLAARHLDDANVEVTPVFTGSHEAALAALRDGKVAAAASFDGAESADLRVLARTGEVPNEPVFCHRAVRAHRRAALVRALDAVAATPEGAAVLHDLAGVTGFGPISDDDYASVSQLLNATRTRLEDVVPGAWQVVNQQRVSPGDLGAF